MPLTMLTTKKQTPFETQYGRKLRTVPKNTFNTKPTLLSNGDKICSSENQTKIPAYVMIDGNRKLTDHRLMTKKEVNQFCYQEKGLTDKQQISSNRNLSEYFLEK